VTVPSRSVHVTRKKCRVWASNTRPDPPVLRHPDCRITGPRRVSSGSVAQFPGPIRLTNVNVHRELLRGLDRLNATTTVLQRARLADPLAGMWEASDLQWWWRRPRLTDDLALPVWFDDIGPVAAAGLTAWGDSWQVDSFAVPSTVSEEEVWKSALEAAAEHQDGALRVLVRQGDALLVDLATKSGFAMTEEVSGTTWMDAEHRPPDAPVDGFAIVDRVARADRSHPMVARNGQMVETRLRQCSLYDPTLDLAIENAVGGIAGYALFWFDHATMIGLLEPMRVEDEYQRRGLARMLLTNGLNRLARKGARRLKVGFSTDAARKLYVGAGFVQTSTDRLLTRPGRHD
jgi:predicted N-acetyltransferase YhbS